MTETPDITRRWIKVGGICGVLSVASYLTAAFAPLPDLLSYITAFAFGPLLAIGITGLYHCLALQHKGPLVQIAAVFGIAAGVTVLIMLTTQQAIFSVIRRATVATDPTSTEMMQKIKDGLNATQLGIDVAWDVLISVSVILFGIAMLRHPCFGRVFGVIGIVSGVLVLSFNLWYFPTPPSAANSIDWGPLVALWLLVTFVLLLRSFKWASRRSSQPAEMAVE
jgi:hypothetical protein